MLRVRRARAVRVREVSKQATVRVARSRWHLALHEVQVAALVERVVAHGAKIDERQLARAPGALPLCDDGEFSARILGRRLGSAVERACVAEP